MPTKFHTACDHHGFVLGAEVTPGNMHESQRLESVLGRVQRVFGNPSAVAVDVGYKTPYICKRLLDEGIRPAMPYTRPRTKAGFLKKHDYVYDEYCEVLICPNNQLLTYELTNREGYRMYRSNAEACRSCVLLSQCTESRDTTKRVSRHIWVAYVEEAEHLRHTEQNKKIYVKRKEMIERVFADLKEKHAMDKLTRAKEGVYADARPCLYESQKTGHLAMGLRWQRAQIRPIYARPR